MWCSDVIGMHLTWINQVRANWNSPLNCSMILVSGVSIITGICCKKLELSAPFSSHLDAALLPSLNVPFYAIYLFRFTSLGESTRNAIYFIPFDFRCHSCALPYQLQANQHQTVIILYSIGIFSDLFAHHIFIDFCVGRRVALCI